MPRKQDSSSHASLGMDHDFLLKAVDGCCFLTAAHFVTRGQCHKVPAGERPGCKHRGRHKVASRRHGMLGNRRKSRQGSRLYQQQCSILTKESGAPTERPGGVPEGPVGSFLHPVYDR